MNAFSVNIKKGIAELGKVKLIECERCSEEPHNEYISFFDEKYNQLTLPLRPEADEDETGFFNSKGYLVVLNLAFQKVLNQIGEDGDAFWLTDSEGIDRILEVLQKKLPFRTVIYNEKYLNL